MMKKITFFLVLMVTITVAMAQTNFRKISYKEAIEVAKIEKKMVFIDFYTTWCGPCKRMAKDVFPQKIVGDYLNEHFVCIKIDAEEGEGIELADHYNVKAYPTFIGIDVNEKEVMRREGYSFPEEFISAVERMINPEKTPERLKERYENGERTADLIKAYAALKMEESKVSNMESKQEAYDMVKDYFNNLNTQKRISEENAFIYLQYTKYPFDTIARYMVEHHNDFPAGVKEKIAKHIEEMYSNVVCDYLSGRITFNKDGYELVKHDIDWLELDGNGGYSVAYRFIECYGQGDMNAYLDLCEKEYSRLNERMQTTLALSLNDLLKTDDKEVLQRAVNFLRSKLAGMEVNTLFFVPDVIRKLEKRCDIENCD